MEDPSIYHEYEKDCLTGKFKCTCSSNLTVEEKQVINEILGMTANLDIIDLEKASCTIGSPWSRVFCPDDVNYPGIISKKEIYSFYLSKDWVNEIFKVE